MVGFRTSKGEVPEWSLVGEGDPSPLIVLSPGLFLAGDGVGRLLGLLLLR